MFSKKKTDSRSIRHQKFRKNPKVDLYSKPSYTGSHVFYPRGGNMELLVYKKIIKTFRKRVKKYKYKLMFNFRAVHIITSKGQNARMGKGKGKASRPSLNLNTNKLFLTVQGLSHHRVCFFFKNFYKQTGVRFLVFKLNKI